MTDTTNGQTGLGAAAADRAFFGHPRGLSVLFFSEMWERFSYYGLRALLILYMTADIAVGGLGYDVATAGIIYGTYTSMVYLMSVPGGWLADRVLGQRRAVLIGGILIAAGHYSLAVPAEAFFPLGLTLIVLGTGLLKTNISVIVGQLYAPNDSRRDAGFSIFYMGINLGAFIGPLITGYLAQDQGFREILSGWGMDPNVAWHWGFGAAGVGMTFGLIQYVMGSRLLGSAGTVPGGATTPGQLSQNRRVAATWFGAALAIVALVAIAVMTGMLRITPELIRDAAGYSLLIITVVFFGALFLDRGWTALERGRLWMIFVLFAASAVFWSGFDQAGSTLNLFADRSTRNAAFGFAFPSTWFQSLNPLFIMAFAPVFASLWVWLAARQPSTPVKFAIGLVGSGVGFWVLALAAVAAGGGDRVSPMWLVGVYLIHTWAELCLSPVGLSAITKLAPVRIVGAMMGVWFLGASVGNFFAGQMASFYEALALPTLFILVSVIPVVCGVAMLVFAKPMERLMGGVK